MLSAVFAAGFWFGRRRALSLAGGEIRQLHSLPGYYGYFTAIWCLLPALAVLLFWVIAEPRVIVALVVQGLPEAQQQLSSGQLDLLINNIQNLAAGDAVSGDVDSVLSEAAVRFNEYQVLSRRILSVLTLGLGGLGAAIAWRRIRPDLRARNRVFERHPETIFIVAHMGTLTDDLGTVSM